MAEEFDYSPELLTVSDDNGEEYVFEVIDRVETDDSRYVAVTEYIENPEEILDSDGEVIILKVSEEDGESYLAQIEDDEEFNEIYEIFDERLAALYFGDDEENE